MDTDALWQAIAAYGNARWRGYSHEIDAADHLSEIKRLLNEAEAEHKSVLDENERLVDEVNEARKETGEQARLNGMGAEREARLMAEVADLKIAVQIYLGVVQERNSLESENAELKVKLTKKAELLRGCYARINAMEKVEAELERIKSLELVAWIVEGQTMGGGVSQYLAWKRSGAGQVPAQLRTDPTPLYALGSKT